MYNEVEYWKHRPTPNAATIDLITQNHIDYVTAQLNNCINILDFGPGDGRMFIAYKHLKSVSAFDITDIRKSILLEQASKYSFEFVLTTDEVVGQLPYNNKRYDAAVATEVLLHQRPENIERVMLELLRVSKKVIVITWQEDNVNYGSGKSSHCFHHDYSTICEDNNL